MVISINISTLFVWSKIIKSWFIVDNSSFRLSFSVSIGSLMIVLSGCWCAIWLRFATIRRNGKSFCIRTKRFYMVIGIDVCAFLILRKIVKPWLAVNMGCPRFIFSNFISKFSIILAWSWSTIRLRLATFW